MAYSPQDTATIQQEKVTLTYLGWMKKVEKLSIVGPMETGKSAKEGFSVQNVEEKWFILILKTLTRSPVLTAAKKHYLKMS
ncbi:hypothetical protein OAI75_01740 [Woeseiaceae bacterium]|nr:hypothetical protein [Woeseiaceae bacterium]